MTVSKMFRLDLFPLDSFIGACQRFCIEEITSEIDLKFSN